MKRFLSDIVKDNPTDYPVLYDLAKAELLTGNRARALEIVQELRLKAPGLVETDPVFLKSLGEEQMMEIVSPSFVIRRGS